MSMPAINCLSPAELDHLFNEPPEPPALPADRQSHHNGRRWKTEPQGRADRRARRQYRQTVTFWYRCQNGDFDGQFARLRKLEMKAFSTPPASLYDWIHRR